MDLREYLDSKGIKQGFFAKELGVNDASVSAYCNKRRRPGKFIIEKIDRLTFGNVTMKDWKKIKNQKV